MGGSTYYSIDGVSSGLTYTATTLGTLLNVSVIRDAGTNDAKRKVNKPTSFTYQFDLANDLTITSTFVVILPAESDAKLISPVPTTKTCNLIDSSGLTGKSLTCTVVEADRQITVGNYCQGGTACSAGSTIKF